MSRSSAAVPVALQAGNVTKVGLIVILALVVIGFVIGLLITAILVRVVIAVIVVAAAVLIWQQRSSVLDKLDTNSCQLKASFFGISVQAPEDVRKFCRRTKNG